MISGTWTGTMNLTEPQAGSDLAAVRTRAEPQGDGTYRIFGNKMWISGGDHEMGENIVHLVLAKVPGGPPGVKGISLFIVPRYLLDEDGNPGERNDVVLAGINHKMGSRGTVNTVLGFGEGEYKPGGEAGAVGVQLDDGSKVAGWLSPSRKLELYSPTIADWGWPEHAVPGYIRSHVHAADFDTDAGEMVLVPTFRLPTMIHTRSGNAKYLNEISNKHPVWMNPVDAKRWNFETGDMIRVNTEIGYYVARVWVTDGIRPGVIAMSHHMGRWRTTDDAGSRWVSGKVDVGKLEDGRWRLRYKEMVRPFVSTDADSMRINWEDPGVHQNLAFPVHPDPHSGMHCWHQKVRVERAHEEDKYGDVVVDTEKSRAVYREWLAKTRPGPGPDGRRRPEFMMRPVMPIRKAYFVDNPE